MSLIDVKNPTPADLTEALFRLQQAHEANIAGFDTYAQLSGPQTAALLAYHRELSEIAKANEKRPGDLHFSELVAACKNIGFDLTCGQCAQLFYTGHRREGQAGHDDTCTTDGRGKAT
jgi:hypothetical protein